MDDMPKAHRDAISAVMREFPGTRVIEAKRLDEGPYWRTLDDAVVQLILDKKTKEPEFQALLKCFGREKLEGIWRAYKAREKGDC